METTSGQPPSLSSLFDETEKLYQSIENSSLPSTNEQYQNMVQRALGKMMRLSNKN